MKLRITVEGKTYDVDVEILPEAAEQPAVEEEPGLHLPELFLKAQPPADTLPGDHLCRSPIAGIVVSVLASIGQAVRKEEPLVKIEAMKMQSTIGAPIDGVVHAICIEPGDPVKAGQVLVELA